MDDPMISMMSLSSIVCLSLISAAVYWYDPSLFSMGGAISGTASKGSGSGFTGKKYPLAIPTGEKGKPPWNVDWANLENTDVSQGALRVKYKAGGFGQKSGAGIKARPLDLFPRDSAVFGCSVYVPSNFYLDSQGKFGLGLCIGKDVGKCATGGNWSQDSGSARISFYRGAATPYIYYPKQVKSQVDGYTAVIAGKGVTGDHMFPNSPSALKIRRGQWNDMAIGVNLGKPGGFGSVDIWVNGTNMRNASVRWRTSPEIRISGILFSTFFGGSDKSYAPPTDQQLLFKNFWVGF